MLAPHGYRWLLVQDSALVEHPEPFGHPTWRDWLATARSDEQLRALGVPLGR